MNRLNNDPLFALDLNNVKTKHLFKHNYGVFIGFLHSNYIIFHDETLLLNKGIFKKIKNKNNLTGIEINSISDEFIKMSINLTTINENQEEEFNRLINEIMHRLDQKDFYSEQMNNELHKNIKLVNEK